MQKVYDVLVVGTGIAGLSCAIYLKEAGLDVAVITKTDEACECNSFLAQGGIIAWNPEDDPKLLYKDILEAGCYYNNTAAVKMLSETGPKQVFDFLIDKIGIKFSTNDSGELDYTEEAAHSKRRILHYEDHTGDEIIRQLLSYAQKIGLKILTSHTSIDLITNNHHSVDKQEIYRKREVMGVYVLNNLDGCVEKLLAHKVVLATGGIGEIFQHTTNPSSATGDGLSMAHRAGADIINAEFVQFHPTAFRVSAW